MAVSEHEPDVVAPRRPDAELVVAARGDAAAFLALYERYFAKVERYVRIRIADRAACEDITSEVFMAARGGLRVSRHRKFWREVSIRTHTGG